MRQWYYQQNYTAVGPVDEAEVSALIADGTIAAESMVWSEGMSDWSAARSTSLSELLPSALPPPIRIPEPPPIDHAPLAASADETEPAPSEEPEVREIAVDLSGTRQVEAVEALPVTVADNAEEPAREQPRKPTHAAVGSDPWEAVDAMEEESPPSASRYMEKAAADHFKMRLNRLIALQIGALVSAELLSLWFMAEKKAEIAAWYLAFAVLATIVQLRFIFVCWQEVPRREQRHAPFAVVLGMLVPIANIYFVFPAVYGLAIAMQRILADTPLERGAGQLKKTAFAYAVSFAAVNIFALIQAFAAMPEFLVILDGMATLSFILAYIVFLINARAGALAIHRMSLFGRPVVS